MTAEEQRLKESESARPSWKLWGPYVSERQWGTVREDYVPDGTAWNYFPHDHARSRAYRWGEDGHRRLWSEDQSCASRSRYGTAGIRSSRSECSALATARAITARTSRILVLPGRDADPFVSQMLYKYPQANSPNAAGCGERRTRRTG